MTVALICVLLFVSSLEISADKDGSAQIVVPCGGFQCIDGLHCCHLAIGCKQCCNNYHCPAGQICKGYKCVSIIEVEDKDKDKYVPYIP